MADVEITGRIKDAHFDAISGVLHVSGALHGDSKKRFEDGHRITTSPVIGFDNDKRLIITRNSAYTVTPWRTLTRCACCDGVAVDNGDADPHYRDAVKEMLSEDDGLGWD